MGAVPGAGQQSFHQDLGDHGQLNPGVTVEGEIPDTGIGVTINESRCQTKSQSKIPQKKIKKGKVLGDRWSRILTGQKTKFLYCFHDIMCDEPELYLLFSVPQKVQGLTLSTASLFATD